MTAIRDPEWEALSSAWRAPLDPVDAGWVRDLVDRHTRRLRLVVAVEVLITVAALAVSVVLMVSERMAAVGWGLAALIHTLVVTGFTTWNRIGAWRPLGEATREYLRLARDRCIRQRRAALVLGGLVVVEAAALVTWALRTETELPRAGWQLVFGLGVGCPLVWSIWSGTTAGRRLARLDRIEQALARVG